MTRDNNPKKDSAIGRLRAVLGLDGVPATRIEVVRRRYVRTRRDEALRESFDILLRDLAERSDPDDPEGGGRREGDMLLVLGKSGAGKTRSLKRLFDGHPALADIPLGRPGCPVLSVSAPSPCGVKELGRKVLLATGYPSLRRNVDGPEIWSIVRDRLEALGVLVLHIDEAQHATQLRDSVEREKLRNTLKGLLVDPIHPIAVVLSGLPEISAFVAADEQLSRRARSHAVEPVTLPTDKDMLRKIISENARTIGLDVDQREVARLLPRLVHASDGRLGVLVEEMLGALRSALDGKAKTLLVQHFAQAFADRTGNDPNLNPYRRKDFRSLDVWQMFVEVCNPKVGTQRVKGGSSGTDASR